jgi:hypothetical protein
MSESTTRRPFWDWSDAALLGGITIPCFLLSFLVTRVLYDIIQIPATDAIRALSLQFIAYGFLFLTLWLILKLRYDEAFWRSMAWMTDWRSPFLTLLLGPALALGVVITGLLINAPNVSSNLEKLMQDRLSVVLIGFFAITLGPLAEELIFRGFLLPLTLRTFGVIAGVVSASLPFSLLHGPQYNWSWKHLLMLFFVSVAFSLVRIRTGSTAASTLAHSAYNLTLYTGYVLQRKDLWN